MKVFEGVIRNLGARLRRIHGNKGANSHSTRCVKRMSSQYPEGQGDERFFFFPLLCPRRKT